MDQWLKCCSLWFINDTKEDNTINNVNEVRVSNSTICLKELSYLKRIHAHKMGNFHEHHVRKKRPRFNLSFGWGSVA